MYDLTFKPYEGDKPYIYVSYSHADKEKVRSILEKLNALGFRIWYDKGIQLVNIWQDYNAKHIKNCCVFMIFNSETSAKSVECQKEILYASNCHKEILPIYLEETKLEDGIEFQLHRWQSVFLYEYDNLDDFYNQIIFSDKLQMCKATTQYIIPVKKSVPTNDLELALKYYAEKNFYDAAKIFESFANKGNTEAMRYLGWMYLLGDIAKGKFITGIHWLDKASDAGNSDAMNQLGVLYHNDNFVKKDLRLAEQYFRKSSAAGNHQGMYNLGCMYLDGEISDGETIEGARWLAKAADGGNADAMNHLGNLYYAGEVVGKDINRAIRCYQDSANTGNHWGMYNLGCMYLDGEIPDSKPFDGIKWLEKAAELGNAEAMNHLGILGHDGCGIVNKNLRLAEKYFRKAANAGNHWGIYNLAKMYLNEEIMNGSFKEGIRILHDAANQGNAQAMYDLSQIYANGNFGVRKNTAHAKYLEQMALENGYTPKKKKSIWKRIFNF